MSNHPSQSCELRPVSNPSFRQLKLLLSVTALTMAGDYFLFGNSPGLGTALFFLLLWPALRLNRPSSVERGKDLLLLFGLMPATAMQTVIEPSFTNTVVLVLLTIYASGHFLHRNFRPYWRRGLEGLLALLHIPLAFSNFWTGLRAGKQTVCTDTFQLTRQQVRRWTRIILPALVLSLPFLFLFSSGNAILGDGIESCAYWIREWISHFEFPTFARMGFWIMMSFSLMSLLGQAPPSKLLIRAARRLPWKIPPTKDEVVSIWQTRIILISVNLLFFAANSIDVFYLWGKTELPAGISHSEFVHSGVNNLITCVILAAAVLLIVFQQDKKVSSARGQHMLAHLWIIQNLLLISSVLLRLKLYVEAYQLSVARLHVAYFLALVVSGFILLSIKISREKKFLWLINTNLLAVFFLFFTVQFLNERGFVADFNTDQALKAGYKEGVLDIRYLTELGPAAWPAIRRAADSPAIPRPLRNFAESFLQGISEDEQRRIKSGNWRSWQYRRSKNRRVLPGYEKTSPLLSRQNGKPANKGT